MTENIWLLILPAVLILFASRGVTESCPSPSEQCDCANAFEGDVICTGMMDIPRNLPTTVTFLDLDSNQIGLVLLSFEMKHLENLTLEQLFLSGTGLEAIEPRCFNEQRNLLVLDLSMNNFERLEDEAFFGLDQLTTLFLTNSGLDHISELLFSYVPSLTYLDLAKNNLQVIAKEFSPLKSLEILLLSSNKIKRMDENALENQLHLRRLDLYANNLSEPFPDWFGNLVKNNGTLSLTAEGKTQNPWECCEHLVGYVTFLVSVSHDYVSHDQLDIECARPAQFQNRHLSEISIEVLENIRCNTSDAGVLQTTNTISESTTHTQTTGYNKSTMEASTIGSFAREGPSLTSSGIVTISTNETYEKRIEKAPAVVIIEGHNYMRHLTDIQVAVIFFLTALTASFVTAVIVVRHNDRRYKKSLNDFLHNLPTTKDLVNGEKSHLTTRTYRQEVAVYGSAGQIIDRHKTGQMNTPSDDTSSEDSGKYPEVQRRKPPPYVPPDSPDNQDDGWAKQVNNSSSNTGPFDRGRMRTGAFNGGFDSDSSDDDVWDISDIQNQ